VSAREVVIQWTETAKSRLKQLPQKVRKGILDKADALLSHEDPRKAHKPLTGPLQGYYRFTYGRYRAIYSVEDRIREDGTRIFHIIIRFVAVGIRKEGDRKDIYNFAMRLLKMGVLDADPGAPPKD
jgi:mRNA-degrading endonuclease RelE of RelBE toxin-antitoxin system